MGEARTTRSICMSAAGLADSLTGGEIRTRGEGRGGGGDSSRVAGETAAADWPGRPPLLPATPTPTHAVLTPFYPYPRANHPPTPLKPSLSTTPARGRSERE